MAAVVPVVVIPTILFAVSPVVVPAVMMAVGINNASRCRFYDYNTRRRRGNIVISVTMPVAIVIARIIGTISTG